MDLENAITSLKAVVPVVASAEGADPTEALNGILTDIVIESRDSFLNNLDEHNKTLRAEYHEAAKTAIMRTTGVSSNDYDVLLKTNPGAMLKLRSDYMSSL